MAYTSDAVHAKLTTLSETQDSIVSTAQWLLFHRRHADRTATAWLETIKSTPTVPKRLNLIYLANELVQQSRARGKTDFLLAFGPLVAEGTAVAYKGAGEQVQGKIRRVVEVWRQRGVFEKGILDAVEGRLGELDRSRVGKGGGKLGGSLFGGGGAGGSLPAELEGLGKAQAAVSKADVEKGPKVEQAEREYTKLTDPAAVLPTPPVHAARLNGLKDKLASAHSALETSISARRELLSSLEKLLTSNRAKLAEDEDAATLLRARKESVETQKKEVEDGIMRGLSNPPSPAVATPTAPTSAGANGDESTAPETEGFTPPPPEVEEFTPELVGQVGITGGDLPPLPDTASATKTEQDDDAMETEATFDSAMPEPLSISIKSEATDPRIRQASTEFPSSSAATNGNVASGDPRLKRRKMSHPKPEIPAGMSEEDIFGSGAVAGVDEKGVEALLAGS